MDTIQLVKELEQILQTLDESGGLYQDQANRLTEITRILASRGFPVEEIQFQEETKH